MNMDMVELIKRHEGLRLEPYKCSAGKLTIGYGHNLDGIGITEDEADYLLMGDIERAEYAVSRVFGDSLLQSLSCNRYSVLVNMMFNLGLPRFKGFKKMIQAVKDGDYNKAAHEMLNSKWAQQVRTRADELIKMMRKG